MNSALTYQRRRSGVSLNFVPWADRAGQACFEGATSNTISAGLNYQFTRNWAATINGGYAVNNSLAPAGTTVSSVRQLVLWGQYRPPARHPHSINFNYGATDQQNPALLRQHTAHVRRKRPAGKRRRIAQFPFPAYQVKDGSKGKRRNRRNAGMREFSMPAAGILILRYWNV